MSEAELPAIRPLEIIATRSDDGRPSLDVREAEIEQLYNVQDMYSRLLFIALCRVHGAPFTGVRGSESCRSACGRVSKHTRSGSDFST